MFTGIIEEIGDCVRVQKGSAGGLLEISASKVTDDLNLGDSLSVQGACLTVSEMHGDRVALDVSPETFSRTNLGSLEPGAKVNLERAVAVGGRLGGHIVQGHVDALATIQALTSQGDFYTLRCQVEGDFERYIVEKGSVALDGISLTVAEKLPAGVFTVAVIPSTIKLTTLQYRNAGDRMNFECDILAKYVESLHGLDSAKKDLSVDFLRQHGFA